MRIITLNVNGLRAAERKGFARWLARAEPWDVVCLQEIKCAAGDVPRSLAAPRKAHASLHPAARKGYSGVALYAKTPPQIATGFGHEDFDPEGR
jgi:exodeoxyribonuclease-3